jgi:hypothetical protein
MNYDETTADEDRNEFMAAKDRHMKVLYRVHLTWNSKNKEIDLWDKSKVGLKPHKRH